MPELIIKQQVEWNETLDALRAIDKCFIFYHNNKPKKDSPEEKIWEAELRQIRLWTIQVHKRRIKIIIGEMNGMA